MNWLPVAALLCSHYTSHHHVVDWILCRGYPILNYCTSMPYDYCSVPVHFGYLGLVVQYSIQASDPLVRSSRSSLCLFIDLVDLDAILDYEICFLISKVQRSPSTVLPCWIIALLASLCSLLSYLRGYVLRPTLRHVPRPGMRLISFLEHDVPAQIFISTNGSLAVQMIKAQTHNFSKFRQTIRPWSSQNLRKQSVLML